jgi:hypothetical protein
VTYYVQEQRRPALRARLIAGYQSDAERDQALAEEWRGAEEEVWREPLDPLEQGKWPGSASAEEKSGTRPSESAWAWCQSRTSVPAGSRAGRAGHYRPAGANLRRFSSLIPSTE